MIPSKSFAPSKQIYKALIAKNAKGISPKKNVAIQRDHYKKNCIRSNNQCLRKAFLTNLPKRDLNITNPGKNQIFACNGFWSIHIFYDQGKGDLDFTIAVLAGEKGTGVAEYCPFYRFDPEEIQRDIVKSCGYNTYKIWRHQVLSDINSLIHLIQEVSKLIDRPISSITCCNRSELLCKKVGLEVIQKHAFLSPMH